MRKQLGGDRVVTPLQIESCVHTVIGHNSVTYLMDHKKAEVLRDR